MRREQLLVNQIFTPEVPEDSGDDSEDMDNDETGARENDSG